MALPPFHPDDLTILDLCAGFGMLAEAVCLGLEHLGLRGRVVAHVERDAAAAAALVARMAGSPLDQAVVFDDLATFDGASWRGLVDCICAGLPCQPYSPAGKRLGNADHRSHGDDGDGPIPHFLRIVEACRPAVVFCENVPAWVVGGTLQTSWRRAMPTGLHAPRTDLHCCGRRWRSALPGAGIRHGNGRRRTPAAVAARRAVAIGLGSRCWAGK